MNSPIFSALAWGGVVLALVSCSSVTAQAPAAMPVGKTLYFDYSSATYVSKESDSTTWTRGTDPGQLTVLTLTDKPNTKRDQYDAVGEGLYLAREQLADGTKETVSFNYRKTGIGTVEIELPGYEWGTTYTLHFDTADSGTATYTGGCESEEWKGDGVRFHLK